MVARAQLLCGGAVVACDQLQRLICTLDKVAVADFIRVARVQRNTNLLPSIQSVVAIKYVEIRILKCICIKDHGLRTSSDTDERVSLLHRVNIPAAYHTELKISSTF
jgi:hypothetical protein